MLQAAIVCSVYILFIFLITKKFGVPYTDITKNTKSIKNGLLIPIGIASVLLFFYAWIFGWVPKVFTYSPRITLATLWVVPVLLFIGSILRLRHARWKDFDTKGIWYVVIGSAFVGFSEELLARGIVATSLRNQGMTVVGVVTLSSLIFGIAHFINYFNGQSAKNTLMQMAVTSLYGVNFYIALVVSGSLWAAILLHALHDFSIFMKGRDKHASKAQSSTLDVAVTIALMILPLVMLAYL